MLDQAILKKIPSPCYVLEEKKLHNNLKILDLVQKASGAKIICALKGFAMHSTFPLVSKYLPGTTASSLYEARLGFEEFGREVHAYSPAYLENEFEEFMRYCGHITFNSLTQFNKYKSYLSKANHSISCALRINPEYAEVETDLYNPCIPGSRLGITEALLGDTLPKGIDGLHFHTLCESSAAALERTLEAVENKFGHLLHQAKWLNLGGGHAITRKGYDIDLLITLIKNLRINYDLEIILEPGSAVGWETGFLKATVLDIVENQGVKSVMLDTSFSAHMPDTIEMPYQPNIWGAAKSSEGLYVYKMGGLTCLAGDVIGDYAFEKPLSLGDTIIFDDMIHYTMVKNNTFNGVNLPSIGIIKENGPFKLVKQFSYVDYRNRLS